MKKTFRILGLAILAVSMCCVSCNKTEEEEEEGTESGNVFVSKTASNKNVVIEEFTGIGCGYCPDGHKRVNQLMAANPGKVFGINIHAGSYASGTYTTTEGTTIADQAGITGYPAGQVNRHSFSAYSQDENGGLAMSRGNFAGATNQILAQPACANVAAKATINKSSRELTVTAQVYYTDNGTGSSNKLNIAILQDSIWGSQSGGSTYNPDQYNSTTGKYCHMHMLRGFVTGQWGEDISPITSGSLITKTFTYNIPATISNETVVLSNLKLIVFVAEGQSEIINACEVKPTLK